MERKQIYANIDIERSYQDAVWGVRRELDNTPDEEKPVAEWINYVEYHVSKAKERVYHLDTEGALAEMRKVAALAVRAMEIHGCPQRILSTSLLDAIIPQGVIQVAPPQVEEPEPVKLTTNPEEDCGCGKNK